MLSIDLVHVFSLVFVDEDVPVPPTWPPMGPLGLAVVHVDVEVVMVVVVDVDGSRRGAGDVCPWLPLRAREVNGAVVAVGDCCCRTGTRTLMNSMLLKRSLITNHLLQIVM